jgi:hypothetical protein
MLDTKNMKKIILQKHFTILAFCFFIEGVATLILLMIHPHQPGDGIYFGYSLERWILIGGGVLLQGLVVFLLLARKNNYWCDIEDRILMSKWLSILFLVFFLAFLSLILVAYIGNNGLLIRMSPVLVYGSLISLEVIIYQLIMFKDSKNFLRTVYKKTDWKCIGGVSIAFVITRLMVAVVTYFSMILIPVLPGADHWRYNPRNVIPDGLIRWDSWSYISIVNNGYSLKANTTAFFPLYPLLIRLISSLKGNLWTSGLWISNISFLIALFYIYALSKQEFDDGTASRTVFYIAAAPAAFFFSTVYTESVFLLFLAACFYYSRNGKWLLAAIAGALASATRLTGVLAASFILFEALWQQGVRFVPKPWNLQAQINILTVDVHTLPKARKGIFASIFSSSGLIAYMVFLYQKFGDPLAFLRAENSWNRTISWDWPLRLIQNTINFHRIKGNILYGGIDNLEHLMDPIFLIFFIPLVIIVVLKFRPSFGLFTLLSFLLPITSGSAESTRRFVLTLIPCYLLLALWGKRPWVDRIIIGISLPLQALFLILFSHWVFAG